MNVTSFWKHPYKPGQSPIQILERIVQYFECQWQFIQEKRLWEIFGPDFETSLVSSKINQTAIFLQKNSGWTSGMAETGKRVGRPQF
jgi:hypothetical protein